MGVCFTYRRSCRLDAPEGFKDVLQPSPKAPQFAFAILNAGNEQASCIEHDQDQDQDRDDHYADVKYGLDTAQLKERRLGKDSPPALIFHILNGA